LFPAEAASTAVNRAQLRCRDLTLEHNGPWIMTV
jgi:hypothetical protein